MKSKIIKLLGIILIICSLLYINVFIIMYNIQVRNVTNGGVMLSIFGQDFYYEYNIEE